MFAQDLFCLGGSVINYRDVNMGTDLGACFSAQDCAVFKRSVVSLTMDGLQFQILVYTDRFLLFLLCVCMCVFFFVLCECV